MWVVAVSYDLGGRAVGPAQVSLPPEQAVVTRRPAIGPRRLGALLLALVCAAIGLTGLATADDGISRRSAVVSGVPVEAAWPTSAKTPLPGVVVAHGLGASRQLMRGFADTLARRGYVVELVDLAGHGANTERLPGAGDGPAAAARLDRDLDVAVRHLRAMPQVNAAWIGLIGHSMGAAAVVQYASAHPGIRATVAISQGPMAWTGSASQPRDLLLLAGGLEFAGYRDGALGALRHVYPAGRTGVTYGDARTGTARRAVIVGGVEHVGVLFSPRTHREVAAWFDGAVGRRPAGASGVGVRPIQRAGSAMLLQLAAMLSFAAIVSALLRPFPVPAPRPVGHRMMPLALGVPVVAVLAAVGALTVIPHGWLPLATAGQIAGLFGVAGAVILVAALVAGPRAGRASPRETRDRRPWPVIAVVLALLTVVCFAVPAQLGWAHAVPVGPRAWVLVPIAACAAAFFGGIEVLCRGHGRLAAVAIHAWTAAGVLAGLGVAVLVGLASSYVVLVAPLIVALLVWQGIQATALRAVRAPAWVTAVIGGVLVAWPIAVTMPIT